MNPFDNPHGEWRPSPWRLVRAISARWYQWAREAEKEPNLVELERLAGALCKSTYAFHLPADARRGSPLRHSTIGTRVRVAASREEKGGFAQLRHEPRPGQLLVRHSRGAGLAAHRRRFVDAGDCRER